MSYNTATEEYRKYGIIEQNNIMKEFVCILNERSNKNKFEFEKTSMEEDMKEKKDFNLWGKHNIKIGIDVKTSKDNKNFSITILNNYYHHNFFEKSKSKYILFNGFDYFYFSETKKLKTWYNLHKPTLYPSTHRNDNSYYFWINIEDLEKISYIILKN